MYVNITTQTRLVSGSAGANGAARTSSRLSWGSSAVW